MKVRCRFLTTFFSSASARRASRGCRKSASGRLSGALSNTSKILPQKEALNNLLKGSNYNGVRVQLPLERPPPSPLPTHTLVQHELAYRLWCMGQAVTASTCPSSQHRWLLLHRSSQPARSSDGTEQQRSKEKFIYLPFPWLPLHHLWAEKLLGVAGAIKVRVIGERPDVYGTVEVNQAEATPPHLS